jgi:hypothetical protein
MVFSIRFSIFPVISLSYKVLLVEEIGVPGENKPSRGQEKSEAKDWSQFVFGSWRNNLNQVVHTM